MSPCGDHSLQMFQEAMEWVVFGVKDGWWSLTVQGKIRSHTSEVSVSIEITQISPVLVSSGPLSTCTA